MPKLYLAHPLEMRHEIQEIEHAIEQETGLELLNPFYDTGRDDIYDIDAGKKTRSDPSLDYNAIVMKDLRLIDDCDGVVAVMTKETHQIGTLCEMWNTLLTTIKPIFVVSSDCLMHPWIRFIIEHSGGQGFASWEEFKEFAKTLVAGWNLLVEIENAKEMKGVLTGVKDED